MKLLAEPKLSLLDYQCKHLSHLVVSLERQVSNFKEFMVLCFPELPRRKHPFLLSR